LLWGASSMAATEVLALRRRSSLGGWGAAAVLIALILVFRTLGLGQHPSAQTFAVVFTAIVVEALPFVLLGASTSALLEVYVPERVFERAGRLPVALQLPAAAVGGFAFPCASAARCR
jgi:hypothetical protein